MHEESINMTVPSSTHVWDKILIPKGWLQKMIIEMTVQLGISETQKWALSRVERKAPFAPDAHSGGLILFDGVEFPLSTNGGFVVRTRFVVIIGNMEIKEPTEFWVYLYNDTTGVDKVKIRLKYSDTKLEEVV